MQVAKFKFIGRISSMGKRKGSGVANKVIWIPVEFHDQIERFEDKQIRITIDDEI